MKGISKSQQLPSLLLRVGIAFVFLYAAVASLLHPLEWAGFLPAFLTKFLSASLALHLMSVYEIGLSLWLLSGRYTRYAAALAALTLAGITVLSLNQFFVTFRDVGLLCAALALFFSAN